MIAVVRTGLYDDDWGFGECFKNPAVYRLNRNRHGSTLLLVVLALAGFKVFLFRFLGLAVRNPEVEVVVRFIEVLVSCLKKFGVNRYQDAVKPARENDEKCETDVRCEKGMENPECGRLKCVPKKGKGESKPSCNSVVSSPILSRKKNLGSYCKGR